MLEENQKLEIKQIQKALRGIKIEMHKTNELLKLLWEFMHENPVIAVTLAADNEITDNIQPGYVIAFKNYGDKQEYLNQTL